MSRGWPAFASAVGAGCAVSLMLVACSTDADDSSSSAATSITADESARTAVSTTAGDQGAGSSVAYASEEQPPPPVDGQPQELGPLGSSEIELQTDDGNVQIGSGSVPDLVPAEFPVPDDFVVQLASETGTDAGFTGVSQVAFDDLVQFYVDGLAAGGYNVEEQQVVAGSIAVYAFDGPGGNGQVAISTAPGGAGRTVIVTFRP